MGIITYKNNDKTQLTPHFNVKEWKCKCGKSHDIKIHSDLPILLEELRTKLNASAGNIYSGYRCATHDKNVGGNGASNRSHSGYAVDIIFLDKNRKPIPSKTVALALEDMGHKYGIGYRCGGGSDASGQTHIDVKPRKWYGDESKSMSKSCCSSFYDYFGIKKENTSTKKSIEEIAKEVINGKWGNGTDRINKLTAAGYDAKEVQSKVNELVKGKTSTKKYIKLTTGVWCRKNGYGFKYPKYKVIPKNTKCELLTKNAGTANGYKWDKIKYNGIIVYLPNKWNKYL